MPPQLTIPPPHHHPRPSPVPTSTSHQPQGLTHRPALPALLSRGWPPRAFHHATALAAASGAPPPVQPRDGGGSPSAPPAPQAPPLEVLVYCGEGAGYQSTRNTVRALQRCLATGVQVRLLDSRELLDGIWRERCLLLVMPGGADLPYCKHLNGRGNSLLKGYVAGGGAYLGICAGAYYACRRVEFEPGSTLEVMGDRELGFFPGTARGAAYPGFDYMSERGAYAAPLRFRPPPPPPPRSSSSISAAAATSRPVGADPGGAGEGPPSVRRDQDSGAVGRAATCCREGGGGGGGVEAADVTPPRLGTHHLALVEAGSRGCGGGDDGRGGGRGNWSRQHDEGELCCSRTAYDDAPAAAAAAQRPAGPVTDGNGCSYDSWVYCRDYFNGGPVFLLEESSSSPPQPPPLQTKAKMQKQLHEAGFEAATPRPAALGIHPVAPGSGSHSHASASSSYQSPSPGAVQRDMEVLAVYPELGNALAAVRCRVGEGVAVLCGTHPEMPHEALTAAVQQYDGQYAEHVAALGQELTRWELQRQRLWTVLLLACCTAAPTGTATALQAASAMRCEAAFPGAEARVEAAAAGATLRHC